jgi:hypothetical protein
MAEKAVVPSRKIVAYLLNPEHPDGWGKAAFFTQFGFRRDPWRVLATALRNHALENDVVSAVRTPLGVRYVIEGTINAPDGRTPKLRSVWFQEGNSPPTLVTAYPLQEKPKRNREDTP